jgi:DMSO/TMAO reductase YedYZ heme-binding membrane subunit
VTPAARILKKPRLVRFRRTIGLFAFSYICLHLLTYIGVDLFFDWGQLWKDILKRPFITLGMLAFALLIPLAVTSTNGMIRRLGRATWQRLHWLIYLIVPLGVAHYYLLVKADHRPPLVYAAILTVLMLWRFWDAWRHAAIDPLIPAFVPGPPAFAGMSGSLETLEQLRVRIPRLVPLPPPAQLRPAARALLGQQHGVDGERRVQPAGVRTRPGQRKAGDRLARRDLHRPGCRR